jgi:hypothetical protein
MFLAPIRLIPTRVSLDLQDLIPRFETSQAFLPLLPAARGRFAAWAVINLWPAALPPSICRRG